VCVWFVCGVCVCVCGMCGVCVCVGVLVRVCVTLEAEGTCRLQLKYFRTRRRSGLK